MDPKRHAIEHDIWVAAYLTALRDSAPEVAELCAADAVKRYEARWHPGDTPGFVEMIRSRAREYRAVGGHLSELDFDDEPE